MHDYSLTHLPDEALLRELADLLTHDHARNARILAHLAEVDARRLYAPAGHSSMFAYCVEELHFSEDSAYKRIRAARAARQFPSLFTALAEGRVHLAAISLLAPHLSSENVAELIEAATHRSKAEVEALVARRFAAVRVENAPAAFIRPLSQFAPKRVAGRLGDMLTGVLSMSFDGPAGPDDRSPASPAAPASSPPTGPGESSEAQLAPGRDETMPFGASSLPMPSEPGLRPERYSVHLTISKSTYDKLRRAQALLSHAIPSGDVAQVLDRALDALIAQLETRKAGATVPRAEAVKAASGPRDGDDRVARDSSAPVSHPHRRRKRYIPARIRRTVWDRDEGQCTFMGPSGVRCSARRFLEFDHVQPVARGGKATVDGLRLRCRAHNQLGAEQAFGVDFMKRKRERAQNAAVRPEVVREPGPIWMTPGSPKICGRTSLAPVSSGETGRGMTPNRRGATQLAPGRVPLKQRPRT